MLTTCSIVSLWPLFHPSEHSSSFQTLIEIVSQLNFLLQSVLMLFHGLLYFVVCFSTFMAINSFFSWIPFVTALNLFWCATSLQPYSRPCLFYFHVLCLQEPCGVFYLPIPELSLHLFAKHDVGYILMHKMMSGLYKVRFVKKTKGSV